MFIWTPPAYVKYTNDGLDETVAGSARGPYVRIRPSHKADLGLLEHELAHVEVFWMTLGLSLFLKQLKWFRLWNEARAYIRQTEFPSTDGQHMTLSKAAELMVGHSRYDFRMSHEEVLRYLIKKAIK